MAQGFTGSQTLVTGSGGANRVAVWASTSTLTSDGNFTYASGTLAIANGLIQAKGDGSSYGLYAGASADVQWYRSAADTWRTPDSVTIDGGLNLNSSGAGTGALRAVQAVATSGSPYALKISGGEHTTLTASTESVDLEFALNRIVQFSAGALTTQRASLFRAPTYAFTSSSTITNAATVAIDNAPIADTSAVITNSYALWVQSGKTKLGGQLAVDDTATFSNNAVFSARTATRVAFFGTAGILSDDSGFIYDSTNDQLQLPTTGSGAGLLVGADVQWYRSAANVWNTPDSVIIQGGLNVGTVTTATNYAHIKTANTSPLTVETTASNGGQINFINAASTAANWIVGVPGTANSRNFVFYDNSTSGAQTVLYMDAVNGNFGIGNSASFGTSAARTLRMPGNGASAVAPTGSVTDYFHIYGADAAAGKAWPSFREEGNTGTTRFVVGCDSIQGVSTGNGTVKMNGATSRNSVGWASFTLSDGTTAFFPYWTTITG